MKGKHVPRSTEGGGTVQIVAGSAQARNDYHIRG